jgi:hypothetical protein
MGMDQVMVGSDGEVLGEWRKFYVLNDWIVTVTRIKPTNSEIRVQITPPLVVRMEDTLLPYLMEDFQVEYLTEVISRVREVLSRGGTVHYKSVW